MQHLEVFLFFNLVHCSIHVIVTLQPFLNTPFPSSKPPPPPFCPAFLAMNPIDEEESKMPSDNTIAQPTGKLLARKRKRFKKQKQRNNEDGTQSVAKVSDNSITVAAKNSIDYKFVLFFCHSSFMPFVLCA